MGTYMSALDMAGVSLSLMHVDDELLELLDAPTDAIGWPARMWRPAPHKAYAEMPEATEGQDPGGNATEGPSDGNPARVQAAVQACAQACIDAEPELTEFDSQVGRR